MRSLGTWKESRQNVLGDKSVSDKLSTCSDSANSAEFTPSLGVALLSVLCRCLGACAFCVKLYRQVGFPVMCVCSCYTKDLKKVCP